MVNEWDLSALIGNSQDEKTSKFSSFEYHPEGIPLSSNFPGS